MLLEEYFSDRATGEIFKTSIPIQIAENVPLLKSRWYMLDRDAISLGHIDLNAPAPVAFADTASTTAGTSVVIDVLHNDLDLKNLVMKVDETTQPIHGTVTENSDGTLTYKPDGDFTGVETFKYWVTDKNGKFDDGIVTVKVGAKSGSGGTHGGDTPNDPPSVDPVPPGHGHDGGHGGSHDHDSGHAHDPGVPSPRVVPTSPASPPPRPISDPPRESDSRPGWGKIIVRLDHDDDVDRNWGPYGADGHMKAAAEAADAFSAGRSKYDLLSGPAVVYGQDFGMVQNVAEHAERVSDQLPWHPGVLTTAAGPSSSGHTLPLQLESSAPEFALPVFDDAVPTFAFRDFASPDLGMGHHAGAEMRPQLEHLSTVASGFIFA